MRPPVTLARWVICSAALVAPSSAPVTLKVCAVIQLAAENNSAVGLMLKVLVPASLLAVTVTISPAMPPLGGEFKRRV